MSAPFGNHPTLGEFIAWAQTQGCFSQSGYATATDGSVERLTKITRADGKRWVIQVGLAQTDILNPTELARLERRLSMKSPWDSIDDSGYTPA